MLKFGKLIHRRKTPDLIMSELRIGQASELNHEPLRRKSLPEGTAHITNTPTQQYNIAVHTPHIKLDLILVAYHSVTQVG